MISLVLCQCLGIETENMDYSIDTVERSAAIKKKELHLQNWFRYGELTDSISGNMWRLLQATANIHCISSLHTACKMAVLFTEGALIWLTLLVYENILRHERM